MAGLFVLGILIPALEAESTEKTIKFERLKPESFDFDAELKKRMPSKEEIEQREKDVVEIQKGNQEVIKTVEKRIETAAHQDDKNFDYKLTILKNIKDKEAVYQFLINLLPKVEKTDAKIDILCFMLAAFYRNGVPSKQQYLFITDNLDKILKENLDRKQYSKILSTLFFTNDIMKTNSFYFYEIQIFSKLFTESKTDIGKLYLLKRAYEGKIIPETVYCDTLYQQFLRFEYEDNLLFSIDTIYNEIQENKSYFSSEQLSEIEALNKKLQEKYKSQGDGVTTPDEDK